jgi:hypothetical protein
VRPAESTRRPELAYGFNDGRCVSRRHRHVIKSETGQCHGRLAEVQPEGVAVTIRAERGFSGTKLFGFLITLGFADVSGFASRSTSHGDGEPRPAAV